jgi:hypothetical protein
MIVSMINIAVLAHASASAAVPAAAPATAASIWGEVTPWEIALLGAGVALTLAIFGFFIWLAWRASREQPQPPPPEQRR